MIKEIVEFMNENEGIEEYFIQDEVSNTYLHYYIQIQEDMVCRDLLDIDNLDSELKKTFKYMTYYQKGMHNKYLDKNKGLGGSSPYILTVEIFYDQADQEVITTNLNDKANRVQVQFLKAADYIEKSECKKFQLAKIKKYLQKHLKDFLLEDPLILSKLRDKYKNQKKKKEISLPVRVYIDVGLDVVKEFYEKFVEKRAFLDTKTAGLHRGTCSICQQEDELSLPYVLSSLGDEFGQKLTNIICKTCTLKLHKFKVMTDNNQLTKPFPLFIDTPSLFGQQTAILKDSEKKKSYREMIKSIYFSNPKDLKNFYLLNYHSKSDKGWKLQIKDLDYIENFQYMTSIRLENFLEIKHSFVLSDFYDKSLSVFQFERIMNNLVFDKKLQNNYFSDYKDMKITYWKIDSKNSNSILKNYLLKYRQNFYDFIYKSDVSALKFINFREMLLDIIIDDLKHDNINKNGYSIYENEIKEKLNLLFSLNQKKETKLNSGEFVELKRRLQKSLGYWQEAKDKDGNTVLKENKEPKKEFVEGREYIENDDKLFAFLCGQLARFLIGKSKSKKENQSHADFSYFTEWQTSKLLKEYMWEIHQKYAHELKFYKQYDNAMSMVMTYSDDVEIENIMEYMIAGYFSNNQLKYQDKIEENENE